ncbi:nascent polypeptide-associated complex subunit alpha, muscle-specific form-like [Moschus berezovskii]|uniref:nascent polypeptide-associated complex subunit alpha, muscle-specific form-like n=1 Tax=Moschus berezovskii TaxID=68408 RepID=UPI0024452EAF|nr:nascent polypeptide-associated complex subunit alpha, muscle-specific form-like [Moschus berezovskii]
MLRRRPGPRKPRRPRGPAPSPRRTVLPPAAAAPHSPQRPGRATPPAAPTARAPGLARRERGAGGGARAALQQAARRGLGTQRVNPVRGHRPAAPPSPKLGLPRAAPARRPPRESPDTPLHSAAPTASVSAATRITLPEEEGPRLLVPPGHRGRPRSGQPRRHLLSPHSPLLFPLRRTGRGLHDPGLTSHLGAGLPGGCGGGRRRPRVPQVSGISEERRRAFATARARGRAGAGSMRAHPWAHCPPASGRGLPAQPPAARERHTPPRRRPLEPQGWRRERGAEGARAALQQAARRGLGTQRVNPVRGHRPAAPPSPKLGLPRAAPARRPPRESPDTPLHSAAPTAFVSAATRIALPEEEGPRLLVPPGHRVRPRSGQPRRHLLSPHSPLLFPLRRTGRGLHDPGLTSHLGAGLPGGCGGGRRRPRVPQVSGISEERRRAFATAQGAGRAGAGSMRAHRPRPPPTPPRRRPLEPQGWRRERGAEGARAALQQAARRGLGTQRVNPVRGHRPAAPPSPKLGLPRAAPARRPPRESPDTPLHSAAPTASVSAATRITLPEEEGPRLLVPPGHRGRPRSGQPRRHLLSPHSPLLFPLRRTGRGLHDPGLTSHLGAGLPGGCGGGRRRPRVPQGAGGGRGRGACARTYGGAGALRSLGCALAFGASG